ncbi:SRPBCC domain-containing protein [Streptomyces sp. NPDC047002]|uniref:SRPBCC family protein n=1 Tax=Streptomyces sp. NPDC047002 TaxID=3155475 RepID=UPI0034513334
MKIENAFAVSVPVDRAWEALTDLEGLAPCMPGAQLTGVEGDVYKGKVKVKVGPVISQFAGTAHFVEKDEAAHHAVVSAKGKDSRGAGNASATIDLQLTPEGDSTAVAVLTDLNITGKLAQFGSGMIKEISEKLLGQFVRNLEERLHAPAAEAPGSGASDTPASGDGGGAAAAGAAASPAGGGSGAPAPAAQTSAAPAREQTPARTGAPSTAADPGRLSAPSQSWSPPRDQEVPHVNGAAAPARPAQDAPAGEPGHTAPQREPATPATAPAAAADAGSGAAASRSFDQGDEPEALDLMGLAGSSVYKRLIPVGIAGAVVVGVIIYFVVR